MVTDALAAGQLVRVLADHPGPTSGSYPVYPGNRLIPPAVRAFVEVLVRKLRARGMGR
jgi:DNA-binding transcriptional LysR family regulator